MATDKKTTVKTELLDRYFPSSMAVGGHTVELKAFKEIAGHDDSLPFQAKVYIDGKYAAVAYNDGWGGETELNPVDGKGVAAMNEIAKYFRQHPEEIYFGELNGIKLYVDSLPFLCAILAENCSHRKTAEKESKKNIVLYDEKSKCLSVVSIPNLGRNKISDFAADPSFPNIWAKLTDKYVKKGRVVLNAV